SGTPDVSGVPKLFATVASGDGTSEPQPGGGQPSGRVEAGSGVDVAAAVRLADASGEEAAGPPGVVAETGRPSTLLAGWPVAVAVAVGSSVGSVGDGSSGSVGPVWVGEDVGSVSSATATPPSITTPAATRGTTAAAGTARPSHEGMAGMGDLSGGALPSRRA